MKYLKNLWANKDGVIAYLPLGCAILYAAGGSGCLALRRYVLPLWVVFCLFFALEKPGKALLSLIGGITLSFMFHLGYGKAIADKNLIYLSILGIGYALATLPFWWVYSKKVYNLILRLIIPIWFLWSVAMCNGWIGFNMEWKIAEIGMGFTIGFVCLMDIWKSWKT